MTDCPTCARLARERLGECHLCRIRRDAAEQARADDLRAQQQRAWHQKTGACGVCGQPGNWCLCRTPCACADLHPCGSGLAADPLDLFADAPTHEQGGLFDE